MKNCIYVQCSCFLWMFPYILFIKINFNANTHHLYIKHTVFNWKYVYIEIVVMNILYWSFIPRFNPVQSLSHIRLCDNTNHSTPGPLVHHQLLESTQTHLYCVGDAIQPSHLLSFPSPSALNLSQHQGLFKWVSSSRQVAKILDFQLQHQFFQWTQSTYLL